MEPALRSPVAQHRAAVLVQVSCSMVDIFEAQKEFPNPVLTTIEWRPPSAASGVMISDDNVLTSAHVVECPDIPTIWVTLSNGTRHRMDAIRIDRKADVAMLRTHVNWPFWHGVAPPILGAFEYTADGAISCAEVVRPHRARNCGESVTPSSFTFTGGPGNSGAGVYDPDGRLIGIVAGPAHTHAGTRISTIPEGWLK
jgi:S1-C subfamily serine protease